MSEDATHPARDLSLRRLLARAALVEERVRRAVDARQATDPNPDDAFRGLYLDDQTVRRLLDEGRKTAGPDATDADQLAAVEAWADQADALRAGMGERAEPNRLQKRVEVPTGPTRLRALTCEFGLTPLDVEILLIALVPDLDDRFEQFYAYLNDDVTRQRPSAGLALGLCGMSAADAQARGRLHPAAPLRAGGLLLVDELERPFLARALRVPDRVTAHLLGHDTPDLRVADVLAPWHGDPGTSGRQTPGAGDPAYARNRAAPAQPSPQRRSPTRAGRSSAWTWNGWPPTHTRRTPSAPSSARPASPAPAWSVPPSTR